LFSSLERRCRDEEEQKSVLKVTATGGVDDEKENKEEKEAEEKEGWEMEDVFWPRLAAFRIDYVRILCSSDTVKLVKGLEQIRLGVAFCFHIYATLP
jgi:hypothetical protein